MLTDVVIKGTKPAEKPFKVADQGGLHLLVNPNGNKLWRYSYRFLGKQKTMAMGAYPETGLKEAREKHSAARKLLDQGIDPSEKRKEAKVLAMVDNSFATVADELVAKFVQEGYAETSLSKIRWLLDFAKADFGTTNIAQVTAPTFLGMLRKIEKRGNYESARRCRSTCGQVFRYAIATGRGGRDLSVDLRDALITPEVKHRAHLKDPEQIGGLLRAIHGYDGKVVTRLALRLAPYVFLRPVELRKGEKSELVGEAEWHIAAKKMKMRNPFRIPLARQAREIIAEIRSLELPGPWLFPGARDWKRPMSEGAVLAALRRMGYDGDEMCGHGFRGMASSILNEMSRWNSDAIERQLSHIEDSNSRKPYIHQAEYWEERVELMQVWADYLDELRAGKNPQIRNYRKAA